MAVIKIFDCDGVKTVQMMGNANEQPYDVLDDDELINEIAEETEDGF